MMENGLLNEVKSLLNNYDKLSDTAKQALGYKELISYLKDDISLERAVAQIKKRSRNFAKRQLTWLRKEENLIVFDIENEDEKSILNEMIEIIKGEKNYEKQCEKRKKIDF